MERNNDNVSSLILKLALKTLQYAVIFGALLILLVFMLFPTVPEDFYASAGNGALSYAFAVKATKDYSPTDRIIKTADKALSLAATDSKYDADAEKYIKTLLLRQDVKETVGKIDQRNIAESPRALHVNLYDSVDYYIVSLYRLRLKRNCTTLLIDGEDCEIISVSEKLGVLQGEEITYLFDQLSYYVDYCLKNGMQNKLDLLGVKEYFTVALSRVAGKINPSDPEIADLFDLKALYRFYNSYAAAGGELGFTDVIDGYDNVKDFYEECLKNYCKQKKQEAYL